MQKKYVIQNSNNVPTIIETPESFTESRMRPDVSFQINCLTKTDDPESNVLFIDLYDLQSSVYSCIRVIINYSHGLLPGGMVRIRNKSAIKNIIVHSATDVTIALKLAEEKFFEKERKEGIQRELRLKNSKVFIIITSVLRYYGLA